MSGRGWLFGLYRITGGLDMKYANRNNNVVGWEEEDSNERVDGDGARIGNSSPRATDGRRRNSEKQLK